MLLACTRGPTWRVTAKWGPRQKIWLDCPPTLTTLDHTLNTDTQRRHPSPSDGPPDADRAHELPDGGLASLDGAGLPMIVSVPSNQTMAALLGPRDELLDLLSAAIPGAAVSARGNEVRIVGPSAGIAAEVVRELVILAEKGHPMNASLVQRSIDMVQADERPSDVLNTEVMRRARGGSVRPKTAGQKRYVEAIGSNTVTFGLGPAGTGKSWLAVAMAVQSLQRREVERIVLTRPAVEAGERLGFLPGDLMAKVDPYLRPLYDALNDMVGTEGSAKLMERQAVEVAPLAFMRGRTLNNSFIILDEAQNTTPEQMKMFLTRLGFGSKMVVTGDSTQADSIGGRSGLDDIEETLSGIDGIGFVHLTRRDVVRHRIVAEIVDAYDRRPSAAAPRKSKGSRSAPGRSGSRAGSE